MSCEQKLPNGRKSKLYPKLVEYYGNENKALEKFASIFTKDFKSAFGDWQRNKFDNTYWGGEPTLEAVLGIQFSKDGEEIPAAQNEAMQKIFREANRTSGPYEDGARYKFGNTELLGVTGWIADFGFTKFGNSFLNFNEAEVKEKKLTDGLNQFKQASPNADEKDIADKKKEIQAQIEKEFEFYPKIAEAGTDVHSLMEAVFKGELIEDLNPEDYPKIKNFKTAYKEAIRIKNVLAMTYGNEKVIYKTEVRVFNEEASLAGTVDLIVIREDGSLDIYDWKTSKKGPDEWSNSKRETVKYQLTFYQQMLKAYNLKVNKVSYLPSKLDLDEDGNVDDFKFEGTIQLEYNNAIQEDINTVISVKDTLEEITIKDNAEVLDLLKVAFDEEPPKKATAITDKEVDDFIKSKEGRRSFTNFHVNNKNRTVEFSDPNIREKVRAYLKDEQVAMNNLANNLFKAIESLRTSDSKRGKDHIWSGKKLDSRFSTIKKYIDEYEVVDINGTLSKRYKWAKLDIPEASALGILLMVNQDTGMIDVLGTSGENLNKIKKLTFGKTVVSNLVASKNKESKLNPLPASNKNIQLMKIMGFILNNKKLFDSNHKIGEIQLISTQNNLPEAAIPSMLYNEFKKVVNLTESNLKKEINQQTQQDLFNINNEKNLVDFYHMLNSDSLARSNDSGIFPRVGDVEFSKRKSFTDELMNLLQDENANRYDVLRHLERREKLLIEENVHRDTSMETTEASIKRKELQLLTDLKLATMNAEIYSYNDITLTSGGSFSGDSKMLSQPDEVKKNAVKEYIKIRNKGNDEMIQRYVEYSQAITGAFKNLYNEKLSKVEILAGDKSKLYQNLYQYKIGADGKIENTFVLRNPNEKSGDYEFTKFKQTPLSKAEKELLELVIKQVGNIRDLKGTRDIIGEREVPLMRASAATKFLQALDNVKTKGIIKAMGESIDELANPLAALEEDKREYEEKLATMTEVFDAFASSERNADARDNTFSNLSNDEIETDLELILSTFVLSHIRVSVHSKTLNQMNSIRAGIAMADMKLHKPFPETLDYIEMLMRGDIYGQRMKDSEQALIARKTEPLKAVATTFSIGASPSTALVNILTNLWQTNSAIMGVGSDRVSMKSWMKASTFVFRHSFQTIDNVNFIDYLNQKFNIHDMEVSRLIQSNRQDKQGIKNFERWLHFMNSYPDYMSRISLFLAEAIEDGTFDVTSTGKISSSSALKWDNKKNDIVYDETKDKRFSELFKKNPNVNSEKYKMQKSLYENIKEDLSTEYKKVDLSSNKLLTPYGVKDTASKRKFANQVYQENTTENKTGLERLAYGSLLAMFKTWLLAKKNLYYRDYMAAEDNLVAGKRVTYLDEETGEYKTVWQGRPMEGIFQSLYFTFKELARTKSILETKRSLEPFQVRNLKHLATDLIQFSAISLLYGILSSEDKDEKKRLEQKFLRYLYYSGKDLLVLNTWNSLTMDNSSLFAVSYVNTLLGDLVNDLYDGAFKEDYSPKTLRNIGLTRGMQDFYEFVDVE